MNPDEANKLPTPKLKKVKSSNKTNEYEFHDQMRKEIFSN